MRADGAWLSGLAALMRRRVRVAASAALLILRMGGEQVEAVHVIADPAQIGFLSRQLATSG